MLYIILGIVILILILILYILFQYGNLKEDIIRTKEAEINIDSLLKKRFDLLNKSIPVIKANCECEDVLEKVVKLRSRKLNSFELDRKLNGEVIEFLELIDKYPELKSVDAFVKIYRTLRTTEEELSGCKKYYNDTIVSYNRQLRRFPTNIIAKILKYQRKDFYSFDEEFYFDEEN